MGEEEEDGKKENWEKKRGWVGKMKKVHHFQANGGGEKVLSSSHIRQIRHTSGCFFANIQKSYLIKISTLKGLNNQDLGDSSSPTLPARWFFSSSWKFVEGGGGGGEEERLKWNGGKRWEEEVLNSERKKTCRQD